MLFGGNRIKMKGNLYFGCGFLCGIVLLVNFIFLKRNFFCLIISIWFSLDISEILKEIYK